jgi:serine/threonine protein kinase
LTDRLATGETSQPPFFTIEKVFQFADQLAKAQTFMLRNNIVNQDIKPDNLLINQNGALKIADFGIIQSVAEARDPQLDPIGTFKYFTPEKMMTGEMIKNSKIKEFDLNAQNTFVCAMITYEALTGHALFEEFTLENIFESIRSFDFAYNGQAAQKLLTASLEKLGFEPEHVTAALAVFARALANNPENRYATPTAFSEALKKALNKEKTLIYKLLRFF